MAEIPRTKNFDSSMALLREGYPFILNRSRRLQTNIFRTRLLGLPVICLHGHEAAQVFNLA